MTRETKFLTDLASAYALHLGLKDWEVSKQVRGSGNFFRRLREGKDCQTRTFHEVIGWFSDNWPEDLEWPSDIPRPDAEEDAA